MEGIESCYEVAVIGSGLIGSAAAKYVSNQTSNCILIGPGEPQDGVYAAWYDSGRIAEVLDQNENWKHLALKSIEKYGKIETESGIEFYQEVGFLTVHDDKASEVEKKEFVEKYQKEGIHCQSIKPDFRFLRWPGSCQAYFQEKGCGYINPRELIRAQRKISQSNNCHLLEGIVSHMDSCNNNDDNLFHLQVKIMGEKEQKKIKAKKVLLAPGAYVNLHSLITHLCPEKPDLTLTTQTVAYLEVTPNEADRLKDMPTACTDYPFGKLDGTYILPPILYPDGKCYLKLGHGDHFEQIVTDEKFMEKWYTDGKGDPEAVDALTEFIQTFVPSLRFESVHGGCCVTSNTPKKLAPFIDEIYPGLILAAGGCGYAAKSSDEIGRLAAVLSTTGEWDTDLPKEDFQVVWKQ